MWSGHCLHAVSWVHQSGRCSALTKAAGDDIGTVLREHKGIDQRQVHLQGVAGCREVPCSAGSILEAGTAVHARWCETKHASSRRICFVARRRNNSALVSPRPRSRRLVEVGSALHTARPPSPTAIPPSPRDRSALPERVFDLRQHARVQRRALIACARRPQQARPQRLPKAEPPLPPGPILRPHRFQRARRTSSICERGYQAHQLQRHFYAFINTRTQSLAWPSAVASSGRLDRQNDPPH